MNTPFTQHFIFFGVSGCGKTEIGSQFAEKISLSFYDADDFHPVENINKMSQGTPLDDANRTNWLEDITVHLKRLCERGISSVLACSALKATYRAQLASISEQYATNLIFFWLDIPLPIAQKRVKKRKFHYMNANLVKSQFETLEVPSEEEKLNFIHIDINKKKIDSLVNECLAHIVK